MKTRRDFEQAGLQIVSGDRDLMGTMVHFEWRENTGVKPIFTGLIDIVLGGGGHISSITLNPENWEWDIDGTSTDIIHWRPSFKQNEVAPVEVAPIDDKPVFTQAMADAGELPLAGSEVMYTTTVYQSAKSSIECGLWYQGTVIAYHGDFVWTSDNGLRQLSVTEFKPLPSSRDIAIKAMLELNFWATNKEFAEALYDAGYRLMEDTDQ